VTAELAGLAVSGATTVVGLMASDAWTQARERLARFFARGGGPGEEDAVSGELQLSQQELAAADADADTAADIEAAWRTRLRRVLRDDPAAAGELRALLDELAPAAGTGPVDVVHNTVEGGVHHGPVVQGRDFTGDITFRAPNTDTP
jgi:hypothetical protein